MVESATGLRESRRVETTRALKAAARRRTLEHGLAGFTVEEVCEDAGVSRRTFFNYFASKELAVVGIPLRDDADEVEAAFVEAGPTGLGTIIDALVELNLHRWEQLGLGAADASELLALIDREPKLLGVMLQQLDAAERGDIVLVERRERLVSGDLRAAAAVHVVGGLLRLTNEEVFATDADDFATIIRRRLAAVRELFA
ncbi:TetR/AcrR family transcriptional regulator [Agromyces seonyuensis]|uniref:TetR family transcriptional regulator n=1 Tax=Agromyces seonyuensis TaxID=2662446 RepID=A0A6I4NZH2_9MICO|nr:TetR/AcrR family transcriptional regulator [Agromyces seonyuensis]MWB97159.1 TetR family transcriptional regulator [Agromyces seonyuensis]